MMELKIKYHDNVYGDVKRLEKIEKGNWIDVFCAKDTYVPCIDEVTAAIRDSLNLAAGIDQQQIILSSMGESIDVAKDLLNSYGLVSNKALDHVIKELTELKKPKLIPLGFSLELPKGYEAYLVPRSSTFKSFGLIQVNSPGIIDESYKGDNDEWKMPVISIYESITIKKGDKIGQFRILQKMPEISFLEVVTLGNEDRGGFGSTGTK